MVSTTHKNDQNAENLEHQPSVIRYSAPVLEEFVMSHSNVVCNVLGIGVDTLNPLSLLGNHMCQLCEDLAQLGDSRLNRLNSGRPLLNIRILKRDWVRIKGRCGQELFTHLLF